LSRKQTKRKLKNYPKIENCVRCAAKIRSIGTANESFDYNGVLLFAARSLGPPVLYHYEARCSFNLNSCKQFEGWKRRHFDGRPRAAFGLTTPLVFIRILLPVQSDLDLYSI